jgi:hypothetical protein
MPGRMAVVGVVLAALCGCVVANAARTAPVKTTPACKKGQLSTKAKPCTKAKSTTTTTTTAKAVKPNCPIVSATGVLGVTTIGTEGTTATALGDKATAGAMVDCSFPADTMTIQVPGHTFSAIYPTLKSDRCTQAADTITCKLSEADENEGLTAVGNWSDTVNWIFAPTDTAATNTVSGTCNMNVVITLLDAGVSEFTKSTTTVCG